ncbi:MAG: GH92 family glycosyl hydrolase [Paludibacteraceae bacterium]|nr:GH92 family glycosyl hydrolase [Paludibacteraceae bacterium]
MKIRAIIVFCLAIFFIACDKKASNDYVQFVNPFIGTGGHGHTFPGAVVPNGAIQPSPDTRIDGWDACSGYHYSDSTINGFSHTHLSGTGCCDYGDVLIMPTVGEQKITYLGKSSQQTAYASNFSHEEEEAEPGYYSVFLKTYGIKAELTASKRGALHRYTFPKSNASGMIVDLDYSLQRQKNENMSITVISDTEIVGSKMTVYWAFEQKIHFYAKFSKPFVSYQVLTDSILTEDGLYSQAKVLVQFDKTEEGEQVFVKVGVSAVDIEGAKNNVLTEIQDWNFDKVRIDAKNEWNALLSRINIETTDEVQKRIFYTALYHTAIHPNVFSDADGRYLGMDHKIHQTTEDRPIYTIFSLWDTFRAFHPLMTIIDPAKNTDFVRSLLTKYAEGGLLPMWELAGNYTATMTGYHAVPVIVDAYMKGNRDFDINLAYEACLKSADYDTTNIVTPQKVKNALVLKSKYYKNKLGYAPCDLEHETVAKGLEYAYNDWCISLFAKELGDDIRYERFEELGKAYRYYYDSTTGFMRGLDSKGEWRTPFSPIESNHRADDYCEGVAWQWTWFVPHDVQGLVDLMGGKDNFILKLDSLFTMESRLEGELISNDISGLIGLYAHGNEPSHHITHLYNYVGQPWKTQNLVDSVLYNLYFDDVNGLSGNEDCGQMSAWYLLNAIGIYQVAPGNPIYSIGRPMFDHVTIKLTNGKQFVVNAKNVSKQNKYIQSATLNGRELKSPFVSHQDIMNGAVLEFVMGDKPSKWGVN